MYTRLGINWASSLLGFLAVACLPFPFLFWKHGKTIRLKCKYAAKAAEAMENIRKSQRDANEAGVGQERAEEVEEAYEQEGEFGDSPPSRRGSDLEKKNYSLPNPEKRSTEDELADHQKQRLTT